MYKRHFIHTCVTGTATVPHIAHQRAALSGGPRSYQTPSAFLSPASSHIRSINAPFSLTLPAWTTQSHRYPPSASALASSRKTNSRLRRHGGTSNGGPHMRGVSHHQIESFSETETPDMRLSGLVKSLRRSPRRTRSTAGVLLRYVAAHNARTGRSITPLSTLSPETRCEQSKQQCPPGAARGLRTLGSQTRRMGGA